MAPAPARVPLTTIVPTARLPTAIVAARPPKGRSFAPLTNCARASKPAIPPIPRAAPRGSHAFQPAPRDTSAVRSRSVRPPSRAPARGRAPGACRAGVVGEAVAALIRRRQRSDTAARVRKPSRGVVWLTFPELGIGPFLVRVAY